MKTVEVYSPLVVKGVLEKVPCLTIRERMAAAIVDPFLNSKGAAKDIENRGAAWVKNFAKRADRRLIIHVGLPDNLAADAGDVIIVAGIMRKLGYKDYRPANVESGALLGTVWVEEVVIASTSPWFTGPYGLVLTNLTLFPTPLLGYRGAEGLWYATEKEKKSNGL